MTHWLQPISKILGNESVDLKDLASAVGADPATFFVNQSLAKCDLRGQDLRGMDLTGTHLELALLDDSTKIDPQYDPRFLYKTEYLTIPMSQDLRELVFLFGDEVGYTYRAWAFKRAVEGGVYQIRWINGASYAEFILNAPEFFKLVEAVRSDTYEIIQIYEHQQAVIHEFGTKFSKEVNIFAMVMLIGMVASKLPDLARKDYTVLKPKSLFRKQLKLEI